MKVELQVKEGVREVLAEVEVEGGSPSAQAKALRRAGLVAGEPVVLDEWTEARRRLYETGLYRRVDLEPSPDTADGSDGEGDRPVKAKLKLEPWPDLRLRYGLQPSPAGASPPRKAARSCRSGRWPRSRARPSSAGPRRSA